jgi:hypothetical protein
MRERLLITLEYWLKFLVASACLQVFRHLQLPGYKKMSLLRIELRTFSAQLCEADVITIRPQTLSFEEC